MKIITIYSSLTGNTKMVAGAIHQIMPEGAQIFPVEDAPSPDGYDFIAIGFWIDRGNADSEAQQYIKTIKNKKVAFFATLGGDPNSEYASKCFERAKEFLDASNTLIGTYICRGKIDPARIENFKKLPPEHPLALTPERIARHKAASTHPDEQDLKEAQNTFNASSEERQAETPCGARGF